ncbi:MAG: bacillithiol biosynthesis protein BshC, partial [Gemmatimonadales bacterium]
VQVTLRERPAEAPLVPLAREPCGPEIADALDALRDRTPDTEFKADVLGWLAAAYRPEAGLADAFADALHALLGPRGLVVFRAHAPAAKRVMAPLLLRALSVTLEDGHLPVLLEARAGRDRLRADNGAFVTRRSGERFSRGELERTAAESPERLSPNVLLRPVVEAALFPTVAYAAGPSELDYLPQARPLYAALDDGIELQTPVPRWSGVLIEGRVAKVLDKYTLTIAEFGGPPGRLEARLVRETLPPDVIALFSEIRERLGVDFGRLAQAVAGIEPTLERAVHSVRNTALAGTADLEKRLVAALKRHNETLVGQLGRARAAIAPSGKPQERVLTLASFLIRYGPALVDALDAEVARWAVAR